MPHPIDNRLMGDRRRRRTAFTRARPGAFTLMETIIAATVTALVATAGTTLVFAVSSGTTQTRGIRSSKSIGQYTLLRIGRAIRQSRAIGRITPLKMTLWANDTNQDDVINAGELAWITYNSVAKRVNYKVLDPASGISPSLVIAPSTFVDPPQLSSLVPNSAKIMVTWADGIESFVYTSQLSFTETRIVSTRLTIGVGAEEVAYQSTASPRASADYLFLPEAVLPPDGPSGRQRRRFFSRWDGFADIYGMSPFVLPPPVF